MIMIHDMSTCDFSLLRDRQTDRQLQQLTTDVTSSYPTCSPIGFPSKTTLLKPLFSITPADIVMHAIASSWLQARMSVWRVLFSKIDTPIITVELQHDEVMIVGDYHIISDSVLL